MLGKLSGQNDCLNLIKLRSELMDIYIEKDKIESKILKEIVTEVMILMAEDMIPNNNLSPKIFNEIDSFITLINPYIIEEDFEYKHLIYKDYIDYYKDYLRYLNFMNIDPEYLLDTIILKQESNLIHYQPSRFTIEQWNSIYQSTDCKNKVNIMTRFMRSKMTKVSKVLIDQEISNGIICSEALLRFLINYRAEEQSVLDSINYFYLPKIDQNKVETNLLDEFKKMLFIGYADSIYLEKNKIELRDRELLDSFNNIILKNKNDSILKELLISGIANDELQYFRDLAFKGKDLLKEIQVYKDWESGDQVQEALQDTTLFDKNSNYKNPDIGDDGRRFDTLSNERLFQELENINLNTIKQEYNTEYMVNTQPKVIHLHKIVQLMGDRYIAKSLIPTPSQQVQIEALLDFLEYEIKVDTNDLWNYISKQLMYRLWYLGVPRIKLWLESEHRFLFVYASNNLHLFADEEMVKEYIQKFETQYAIDGNRGKADIYLSALERIHTWKEFNPSYQDLPPRRIPARSFEDSYEWCVKYIWPAFVKVGWLVEDK